MCYSANVILPIYTTPHPILIQPCEPVGEVTAAIRALAADMRETMHNAEGIGLAAPQVGQTIQLCVLELPPNDRESEGFPYMALLNPRITWKSPRSCTMTEGCLSIPGVEGTVNRPEEVRVKAKDLEGNTVEIRAAGLLARALQHEIDHLHGVLFTSYIPKKRLRSRPLVEYPQVTN